MGNHVHKKANQKRESPCSDSAVEFHYCRYVVRICSQINCAQ